MAFTTRRGRPRAQADQTDPGTPELRLKHALGLTAEPIDLCLTHGHITQRQHWCALHLRWLYTLRYGAPSLTTHYTDHTGRERATTDPDHWRSLREEEYLTAVAHLKQSRHYEPVMRIAVFNEPPLFLKPQARARSWEIPTHAAQLDHARESLRQGLDILATLWRN